MSTDRLIHRRALLLGLAALPLSTPLRAQAAAPAAMLANVYRPGLTLSDYWASEKYDGVRGLWDGETLWTRHGRRIEAPAWFTAGWPAVPLDGELWAGRGRFTTAASATASDASEPAWQQMRYMVFDAPAQPGNFDVRLAALPGLLSQNSGLTPHRASAASNAATPHARSATLQQVAQSRIASEAQLQAWLNDIVAGGGEGLVLHRGDTPYRGERSDALLKLKPHEDAEATVVGHLPGKGKYSGLMGALQLETPEGLRFRLGSGFSDADRHKPPPIGSRITYRYQGQHPNGAPRFASYLRLRVD